MAIRVHDGTSGSARDLERKTAWELQLDSQRDLQARLTNAQNYVAIPVVYLWYAILPYSTSYHG